MQNNSGECVDAYIPRKCSALGKLITPKDHASAQINIAAVDEDGHYIHGEYVKFALCGQIRSQSRSDESINRLATEAGYLQHTYSF